jgi:predicted transcriptional regulator of viral defense system
MKAEDKTKFTLLVKKLAQRPDGMTVNDLMTPTGLKRNAARGLLDELVKQGALKRVKLGHRSISYEAIVKPKFQASVHVPSSSAKLDPNAPAIIPPGVKITICPSRWS